MGLDIQREVISKTVPKQRMEHLLFTMSGNPATEAHDTDFSSSDSGRPQYLVNLRIIDHGSFVEGVFEKAKEIGDD